MVVKKQIEKREANLSHQQMQQAIPKIERRISELEDFDVNSVNSRNDPRISALSNSLETLLVTVFGSDTVEYERYEWEVTRIDTASVNLMHSTPIHDVREGLIRGIQKSVLNLKTIKRGFLEELEDAGLTTSGRVLKAYEGLELHPAIERAVGNLFHDGHYSNAIEDAVKALNGIVRLNSGIEQDGVSLMETAFSPKNPVLKFNAQADASDIDEQKGFMWMFSGAVAGLRNPRAHKIIKDDPEMALEFIAYISLLAKLVDKSKK